MEAPMSVQDLGDRVVLRHTVRFGDCDPALIAYTGTIVDYALIAIDEFWKVVLDGKGWFELNLDHDIGTAFVNLSYDFTAPITPRAALDMQVRVVQKGKTSITFSVTADHAGQAAFAARLTCVFIRRSNLKKISPPDWIETALSRFLPDA
jgi:acyl-CoA thioesterase FadM